MKSLILSILCAVLTQASAATNQLQIALSPWLSHSQLQRLQADQLQLILRDAPAGTRFRLFDGWHLISVTDFVVPDKYRERYLKPEIGRMLGWFQSAARLTGDLTNSGALKTPEVLDELARSSSAGSQIVLIGSTIFLSPSTPQFSFCRRNADGTRNYAFPSDGHFPLQRNETPFGLAGRERQLSGVHVHFLYGNENEFPDGFYKETVKRFWSLFAIRQSGRSVNFSADRRSVFASLFNSESPAFHYECDPALATPEMLRHPHAVPPRDIPVRAAVLPPVQIRPTEQQVIQEFNSQSGPAEWSIGIMWDAPADVDVYVILNASSKPLCFRNQELPGLGRHLKDFLDANSSLDWEQVVLNKVPSSEVQVFANLYSVRKPLDQPLTGKFMVRQNGRTQIGSFRIEARTGDGGTTAPGQSPHWTRLDWRALASPTSAQIR